MILKSINDLSRHISPIQNEIEHAVTRVTASGWFVLGPEVNGFEKEFAAYCGSDYCISLGNGTDALELALRALNIGAGKKVITVANSGMYSSVAILATGATPVYADVEVGSGLVDLNDVKLIISEQKIDAIIVTHLYGLMANMHQILQIAKDNGIPVIEDCAQAHGAILAGKKAGSFGDISCFSFYPTKNLGALGDGGAIVTSHSELAERVRQLRQYGWKTKYRATLAGGRNSRLDEMQAAILRVMLPFLDQWNARRRQIACRYTDGINNEKILTPKIYGDEFVAHLYVINTDKREGLKAHLASKHIPTDIHYPVPDYRQPAYAHLFGEMYKANTEKQCASVLTLPCFPEMADQEVDAIIASVNTW